MKLLLIIALSLTSIFSQAYTIREGGRTIGAGQVTEIISIKVGVSEDDVDTVLTLLGKKVGAQLATHEELIVGSMYYTTNYSGVDCPEKTDPTRDDCTYSNDFSSMVIDANDDNLKSIFLNQTMNDMIASVNNYVFYTQINSKTQSNLLPLLNALSYEAWQEVGKYNPIEQAFKSLDTCVQFREDYLEILEAKLETNFVDKTIAKEILKLKKKALIKSEHATKRHIQRHQRLQKNQADSVFNLSKKIFEQVSNKTNIDISKIEEIEKTAAGLITQSLNSGQNISVTGLGDYAVAFNVDISVTPIKSEVKDIAQEATIVDISDESITSPISWTPSSSTQNALNNNRGVCRYGSCFCPPSFEGAKVNNNSNSNKNKNTTSECKTLIVEQTSKSISALIENAAFDFVDYNQNNDEQAGKRVRKAMQDLKNLAQDIRAEVTGMKNK
ncbi:hypothetical protein [Marinicellulosiphila megalodicopiae]|uniref:hypothetical protein n=1 Tax=Marinicellulosiphila megalodicopiae TaxID=2724896 RepID=UPI003BAE7CA5